MNTGRCVVAVHDEADVALGGDVGGRHDQHLLHGEALDRHAEDLRARRPRASAGFRASFTPPALPAAAGVHLRLDDDRAADPPGDRLRLGGRRRDVALEHRDARGLEQRRAPGTRAGSRFPRDGRSGLAAECRGTVAQPGDDGAPARLGARSPPPPRPWASCRPRPSPPPRDRAPRPRPRSCRRIGRAAGVPQPSNTASTLVRIISTSASSCAASIADDPILVHYRVHALEAQQRILVHRRAAAARRDHDRALLAPAAAPRRARRRRAGAGLVAIRRQSPAPVLDPRHAPLRAAAPPRRRISAWPIGLVGRPSAGSYRSHQRLGDHRRPRRAARRAAASAFCSDCCSM